MHYIGMDCHITTLDFAVVNEAGRLVKANSVATSVNGFMGFVKTVPPPRTVYMEEGTLAAWALETCVRFREKLVITDAKKNPEQSEQAEKQLLATVLRSMKLNSDSDLCGGESIGCTLVAGDPWNEYASPISPAISPIRPKEKDVGHERGKGRV